MKVKFCSVFFADDVKNAFSSLAGCGRLVEVTSHSMILERMKVSTTPTTIVNFSSSDIVYAGGKIQVLRPINTGLKLAFGSKYATESPSFQ